jgi:hypothetical protein
MNESDGNYSDQGGYEDAGYGYEDGGDANEVLSASEIDAILAGEDDGGGYDLSLEDEAAEAVGVQHAWQEQHDQMVAQHPGMLTQEFIAAVGPALERWAAVRGDEAYTPAAAERVYQELGGDAKFGSIAAEQDAVDSIVNADANDAATKNFR